ncbi:MAG TPA: extracellular solute-binding protein [Pyrinomonadaceae bacterium]|nr:extracellular solute-binding protein [Pyrinomonadaceae bacterium]
MKRSWLILIPLSLLIGCAPSRTAREDEAGGRVSLTYWSATNAQELEFANEVAAEWNRLHPEVQVRVEPVPAGQSSEEVILASIASGTTPDIYSNVFPGALADLQDAESVVQLDAFPDFLEVMRERMPPEVLEQYRSSDQHYYQVAWKSNPVMVLYNTRMLREAGVESLPATYSEFLDAAARVTRDRDGDGQVDQWMATIDYYPIWYKRLFDYYPLYLAAGGTALFQGRRVVFGNEQSLAAFRFLRECFARGYVPVQTFQGDVFLDGRVAAKFTGPYSISHLERYRAADFEYGYGPIPRPDGAAGRPASYADPKSIVIFKTCRHPREAWEFVKFVISKQNDLRLLELTSQLPIRKGLLEDEAYAAYFERNPRMVQFAEQLMTARSIDSIAELKEVFDIIAQEVEESAVFGFKPPEQAVHDAAGRSQQILDVE